MLQNLNAISNFDNHRKWKQAFLLDIRKAFHSVNHQVVIRDKQSSKILKTEKKKKENTFKNRGEDQQLQWKQEAIFYCETSDTKCQFYALKLNPNDIAQWSPA